ncbi:hypothetical protein [Flavihumibacter sp. CACIAM 22H1]|uniref:hypothetical protein n=1 Tax=Flavihumibacter sp. CACIAM 22H1 TaxID=1812911 RepID=UPI0007A835D8|nr:hypothetical protein [Flavihumibacter sp. CACIAM 22H1]KYP15225.1 MAG: hypothetical protein A1D16_15030 [Flavihumibacter sp. CACIAM 22H1]
MNSNSPLTELINSFRHGLFMNFSNQEFRLPNGVARLIHADDNGNCWLLFHSSLQDASVFEKEFPAKIRFYEKGKDYYVEATGKAVIQTSPDEWSACPAISYGMAKALRYHGLVVCMKMSQLTVTPTRKYPFRTKLLNWLESVTDWFMGEPNRKPAMGAHVFSS